MKIVFWSCLLGIVHTYFVFPFIMYFLEKFTSKTNVQNQGNDLPNLAIILAVFNEEKVIEEKIKSTFKTNYPLQKITFYIGSDNSTDATNLIIERYSKQYPQILFTIFKSRTGKAGIINHLASIAEAPILIFTDANVFFNQNTLYELVKDYQNEEIGVISANIINNEHKKEGISYQEKKYLEFEKQLKFNEGKVWGTMIGAFGGCYSIRKNCFKSVPPNFLMDDFFISMNVFLENKKAILNLDAVCYEDVSDKISEEFRRKIRISAGNFQNLFAYKKLLLNPFSTISFSFWSHKIFRWITPFLLLGMLGSSIYLAFNLKLFYYIVLGEFLIILITFAEILLNQLKVNIKVLRFLTHFFSMNLALFLGFFKFIFGIKTNVWKPTERFQ